MVPAATGLGPLLVLWLSAAPLDTVPCVDEPRTMASLSCYSPGRPLVIANQCVTRGNVSVTSLT